MPKLQVGSCDIGNIILCGSHLALRCGSLCPLLENQIYILLYLQLVVRLY